MVTCKSVYSVFLLLLCLPYGFSQVPGVCDDVIQGTTLKETAEIGYVLYYIPDATILGDWTVYIKLDSGNISIIKVPDLDGIDGTKVLRNNNFQLFCGGLVFNSVNNIIEYVNEYAPVFPLNELTVNIQECFPFCGAASSPIVVDLDDANYAATDLDRVPVGVNDDAQESVTYFLDASGAPFQYDARLNAVIIAGQLDFDEGQKLYQLVLYATDTGGGEINGTKLTGNKTLTITIEDYDDLDPIFDSPLYSLRIQEEDSSLIGLPMTTTPSIRAFDQDLGINDSVSYSIVSGDTSTFAINSSNGELTINKVLDREIQKSYDLKIKACQVNNAQKCAESIVVITVEDVNDNRPEFNPATMAVSMVEERSAGTIITAVTAHDADGGTNAAFTYVLHTYQNAIDLNTNDGTLTIKNSTFFDREENPGGLNVLIGTVETSGESGGNLTMTITLEDINDNSPTFKAITLPIVLRTGIRGTFVGQVDATDPDFGDNGAVWYSITDAADYLFFTISTNNGSIYIEQQLKDEITYNCIVQACDNPQTEAGRLCSMTAITVQILSSNSSFSLERHVSVSENVPRGTLLTVLPMDVGFIFVVVAEADSFRLDTASGDLTTDSAIDREKQSTYIVIINRMLGSEPKGIYTVNVEVLDLNDNIPTFYDSEYTFNVPVTAKSGDAVGIVASYDNDTDPQNKMITYTMKTNSEPGFKVDNSTGQLELVSIMTHNVANIFIMASDHGTPSLQSTVTVTFIYGGDDSYVVDANVDAGDIEKDKEDIRGKLDTVLGVSSNIVSVTNGDIANISSCRTEIRISATKDGKGLSKNGIESLILANNEKFKEIFRPYEESCGPQAIPVESSQLGTLQIVLIAVGSLFLILAVALLIIMYSQRQKFKRYKRLNRALTIPTPNIYEVQEVKIDIDDELSLTNNSVANLDAVLNERTQVLANGHLPAGTLNPAYESDSETETKQVENHKHDSSSTETNETFVNQDDDEGFANGHINLLDEVLITYEDSADSEQYISVLAPISVETNSPADMAVDYNDASESSPQSDNLAIENPVYNVDVDEPTPDYGKSVRFQQETIVIATGGVEPIEERKDDVDDYVDVEAISGTPLSIGSKSAARQQTNADIANPPPPPPTDTYDTTGVSADPNDETSTNEDDAHRQQIPLEVSGDSVPLPPPPPPLLPPTPSKVNNQDKTGAVPSTPKMQVRQSSDIEKSLHAELLARIKQVNAKKNEYIPNAEEDGDTEHNIGSTDM